MSSEEEPVPVEESVPGAPHAQPSRWRGIDMGPIKVGFAARSIPALVSGIIVVLQDTCARWNMQQTFKFVEHTSDLFEEAKEVRRKKKEGLYGLTAQHEQMEEIWKKLSFNTKMALTVGEEISKKPEAKHRRGWDPEGKQAHVEVGRSFSWAAGTCIGDGNA
ncbi:MAG: hypothetical protein Q9187_003259 [Circinaria calcarea]